MDAGVTNAVQAFLGSCDVGSGLWDVFGALSRCDWQLYGLVWLMVCVFHTMVVGLAPPEKEGE